jgi:hypothetical protein
MIMEPTIEALTICTSPFCRAKTAMRNSTTLPKVALISADIVVETRSAMIAVDSAIRWVMPIIAIAEVKKTNVGSTFRQ